MDSLLLKRCERYQMNLRSQNLNETMLFNKSIDWACQKQLCRSRHLRSRGRIP